VLSVNGEIDAASLPILQAAADGVLDSGSDVLWLDLSGTTFMDPAGISFLVQTVRRAHDCDQQLAIVLPEGNVRRVLRFAGLEPELPLHDHHAAAGASTVNGRCR